MTMKLKFAGAGADKVFEDIAWQPVNRSAGSGVLTHRAAEKVDAYERFAEPERLADRLAGMSLGALLYYVLVGEGKITDELV